jgi:hypothetical protein
MMDIPKSIDILHRLKFAAHAVDDLPARDIEELLMEAAEYIKTLRLLVGIRDEVWLEDVPPEGHS